MTISQIAKAFLKDIFFFQWTLKLFCFNFDILKTKSGSIYVYSKSKLLLLFIALQVYSTRNAFFLQNVIVIGGADGCRPFSDLLADDGKCFPSDVTIDPHEDIVILPYSSGTTGLPKGVMLSHFNVVANLRQFK
jgi:hypothetical protein